MTNPFTNSDTEESTTNHATDSHPELDNIRIARIRNVPEETPLVVETGFSLLQLIAAAIAGGVVGGIVTVLVMMLGTNVVVL